MFWRIQHTARATNVLAHLGGQEYEDGADSRAAARCDVHAHEQWHVCGVIVRAHACI